MKKQNLNSEKMNYAVCRVCAVLLCLCLLTGIFQSFIVSANAIGEPNVSVCYDGDVIASLELPSTEKAELVAHCGEQGSYTFRWQVLADASADLWVNIYDGTSDTLSVSNAMLAGVLDESNRAYIRAVVKDGSLEGRSEPVCITVLQPDSFYSGMAMYASNAEGGEMSEIVRITINYLDAETKRPIYTSFTAQVPRGQEHSQQVESPAYLGYMPYYNPEHLSETEPNDCITSANHVAVNVPAEYTGDDVVINVYYKAVSVSYAVRYFFQNVNDDFYTEDSKYYKVGMAQTGTIITDADLAVDVPGFTKLYHYPQSVAGDGSTVFECYYDRNYSMLKYDLGGGYGVEPVYARYGTPILVGNPVRPGYTFKGWQLMDENGNYGQELVSILTTIPATSQTYRAVWETVDTSYTIVYWLQNADDDDYDFIGTEMLYAASGQRIEANDLLKADTPICGMADRASHTHKSDAEYSCYPKGFALRFFCGFAFDYSSSRVPSW